MASSTLLYIDIQKKFEKESKKRPIRYAARRDSYIFSYYRSLLAEKYEIQLQEAGLSECVTAYRKIPVSASSTSGKCNIHFAQESFDEIKRRGDCYAVALDISSYFDNIDHKKLEGLWCDLLKVDVLPPDHKHVFKNITNYAEVNFDEACRVLGFKEDVEIRGVYKFGYKREISKKEFFTNEKYKQLCSPKEFREKIVKLINKNPNSHGIPQGSPISDILANLYLYPFDREALDYSVLNDIYYRRYSDDILLIIPRDEAILKDTIAFIKNKIQDAGETLEIKDKKTLIKEFYLCEGEILCRPYLLNDDTEKQHKGDAFEYLGFAFDGRSVRIKDSTMHRFNRKIIYGARHYATELVARYENKSCQDVMKLANFSNLYQKYGRIKDYKDLNFSLRADKKKLTFLAYAKKADSVMAGLDSKIMPQMKNHKKQIKDACNGEIVKQWAKRKSKAK